jgi:Ca2+-binding EF-hand superfamily protein
MSLDVSAVTSGAAPAVQTTTGASAAMPPRQKMTALFQQIDTSGSGSISAAQLHHAFQTLSPPASFQKLGATALLQHLDPQQTGQVSKSTFVNSMSALSSALRSAPVDASTPAGPSALHGGAYVNTQA